MSILEKVRRTSKFAQAAAGLSDKSLDGFIGKQSIQAINKTSDELFMLRLTVLQVAHYTNICIPQYEGANPI